MKMCCLRPAAAVTQIRSAYWDEWSARAFVLTAHWRFGCVIVTEIDGGVVAACPALCDCEFLDYRFIVAY